MPNRPVPLERLPAAEVADRVARVRRHLARRHPDAAGLLVFSRLNLYYFTGSPGGGALWIPRAGTPVLALRRAVARAREESPLAHIAAFKSFAELPRLAADAGHPWPAPGETIAAEMGGLSWARAEMFRERLGGWRYVDGGDAVARARAVKSPWEIAKLREAGRRHARALDVLLPARLKPGMTEFDVAAALSAVYAELGFVGPLRMRDPGDEIYLGHVSAGASALRAAHFNGPLGVTGLHASAPTGGSPLAVWARGAPLGVDSAFSFEGYQTDKTRIYFAGADADLPADARRAHEAALAVGRAAAADLKPGVAPSALYRDALARIEDLGWAAGFQGLGDDRAPFLGHGIGLSVDEWPALAARFDDPLEENMVFAIEPKIALPGFGMVGMEETYRVGPDGGEALTGGPGPVIAVE